MKISEQSESSVTVFAWLYGQLMEFLQLKDSLHTWHFKISVPFSLIMYLQWNKIVFDIVVFLQILCCPLNFPAYLMFSVQ